MSGTNGWRLAFGANVVEGGTEFRVWAPASRSVDVVLYGPDAEAVHPLGREEDGWFAAVVPGAGAGTRYRYRLDGADAYPDPASRSQPDGVHDPSEVVDPSPFRWTDEGWGGVPADELVIYEVHVGTATGAGTFDALVERLDEIAALGATAVEPMPIAEFPGHRNWGYDGVFLYAPESSYGGADGFRRFVDAAHARGLAVILDVVYNHLGPEGNYLHAVTGGQYFTDRHHTPWGDAIDYARRPVREFAIQNALHWAHEYHVDGLRMDATHAILDDSDPHLLQELSARVRESLPEGRHFVLIAEDERNERRVLLPQPEGIGLDGVWADDIHHQLRRHTAGDHEAYFSDYTGSVEDIVRTLRQGWFYEGQESQNHGAPRGTPADGLPPRAFVHCIQNHDQVGNRAFGDRLTESVSLPVYRAASALLLLSPYTPLLWMGQEWAATTPFQYFTDHPEELGKLVTEGRRKEFGKFSAFGDPAVRERIPDPQAPSTFESSRLRWDEAERPPHAGVRTLYRELLALRRTHPALVRRDRERFAVAALGEHALALRRTGEDGRALLLVVSFQGPLSVDLDAVEETRASGAPWDLLLSTEEARFGGDAEGEIVRLSPQGRLEMGGAGAVVLEGASDALSV
ncbi:MAG TPA: malto-oligosyltrehalose trehalohydrolase [Longimicrobium sp.]|uniref:malto-oligosyltrehalose trehalohydrolase n=1 Tax=Longimicrobium sp. TaxID=2029185 RepID=UPI002ED96BC1